MAEIVDAKATGKRTASAAFEENVEPDISKHGKAWTAEEDHRLLELVKTHGSRKSAWPIVAQNLPGRTLKTCRIRWWRFILPSLEAHGRLVHEETVPRDNGASAQPNFPPEREKKNRVWSREEENKLFEMVKKYGLGNWRKVAEEIPGRSAGACDLHWYLVVAKNLKAGEGPSGNGGNSLGEGEIIGIDGEEIPVVGSTGENALPAMNGMKRRKWTPEDDALLKQLIDQHETEHGIHQSAWPLISHTMGRTELACRWRYNMHSAAANAAAQSLGPNNGSHMGNMQNMQADGGFAGAAEGFNHQLLNSNNADVDGSGKPNETTLTPRRRAGGSKRRRWTVEEDQLLRQLVENRGTDSWAATAAKLETGRSGDSCQYHWQYELYPKLLLEQQQRQMAEQQQMQQVRPAGADGDSQSTLYLQQQQLSNANVSTGTYPIPVGVAPHTYSSNTRANEWYKWTTAEDNLLRELIQQYGCSGQAAWEKIANQMPGRTLNSVRMRWKQALRPALSDAVIAAVAAATSANTSENNINHVDSNINHHLISNDMNMMLPDTNVNGEQQQPPPPSQLHSDNINHQNHHNDQVIGNHMSNTMNTNMLMNAHINNDSSMMQDMLYRNESNGNEASVNGTNTHVDTNNAGNIVQNISQSQPQDEQEA